MCCKNVVVFKEILEASKFNNFMLLPSATKGYVHVVHSGCLDDLLQSTDTIFVRCGHYFVDPILSFNAVSAIRVLYKQFMNDSALRVPDIDAFLQCQSVNSFHNAPPTISIDHLLNGESMPNMWFLHPWWFVHNALNTHIAAAQFGYHIVTVIKQQIHQPETLCCALPSSATDDVYGLLVFLWLVAQDLGFPVALSTTDMTPDVAHLCTAHLFVALSAQMTHNDATKVLHGPLQFRNL